jgi:arylamine N-acetyltransferase
MWNAESGRGAKALPAPIRLNISHRTIAIHGDLREKYAEMMEIENSIRYHTSHGADGD